jgi:hypothetical protein
MKKILKFSLILTFYLSIILYSQRASAQMYGEYETTQEVTKSCGKCGGAVSSLSKVGDTCPHCHVIWGRENSMGGSVYNNRRSGAQTSRKARRGKRRRR